MVTRKKSAPSKSAIGYIRVSTQEQRDKGHSIEAQEERIRAYASMRAIELSEIVIDAAVSGGTPIGQREGGKRVVEALKRKDVAGVIAVKLDRLFRSAADCLTTVEAWDRAGVALHLVDLGGQTLDTSTSAGKMFLTMIAGFAEFERSIIGERTSAVLQSKKSRGEATGGAIPFGYQLSPDGIHLEENQAEQETVNRCVQLDNDGLSLRKIADKLAREGRTTRKGGAFAAQQVQNILKAHITR